MRDIWHQWVIRVRVCQHRADREEHLGDRQSWTPLVPEDIKTDTTVGIDVRVVNLGLERDLRRLEGIVRGEGNRQEEDATRVGRVALSCVST